MGWKIPRPACRSSDPGQLASLCGTPGPDPEAACEHSQAAQGSGGCAGSLVPSGRELPPKGEGEAGWVWSGQGCWEAEPGPHLPSLPTNRG